MAKNAPKPTAAPATVSTPTWTVPKNEHFTSGGHPVCGRIVLPCMKGADGHYCVVKGGLIYVYAYTYKEEVVPTTINDNF